ncbi:MAG: hypothetical protein L3K07_01105 [Thermoplasmata archaeon]|nr:hypothetical protein [Thermoplasmata archaeon]
MLLGFSTKEVAYRFGAMGAGPLLLGAAALGVLTLFLLSPSSLVGHLNYSGTYALAPTASPSPLGNLAPDVHLASESNAGLTLGIGATPSRICAYGESTCPAGTGLSRVTMTAVAGLQGLETWPAVQVAFVIETTPFDGVYDGSVRDGGSDPCITSGFPLPCEESNGVPFFVAHAQQIADSIQSANPHSLVSFALVDYFATKDNFDDGDGSEYNVDIPTFIPAAEFGPQVRGTFQANQLGGGYVYGDSDFSDNILHSSSITALYGAIVGSGLDWSPDVHHVVVWIGSTVPRDPTYAANYCVTPSSFGGGFSGCSSSTCEPAYSYGYLASPNCEGWIRTPDANVGHSIAGLARTASQCTSSIGGVCTIDTIDLYDGMTDGRSLDWPVSGATIGPGMAPEMADAAKVIEAGCDLAAATGGSWDGPDFASCPNGQTGTLLPVFVTDSQRPNLNNPTLLAALRSVSFGPVIDTTVANGTGKPLFTFVPFGHVAVAPVPDWHAGCRFANGGTAPCPSFPQQLFTPAGQAYYGWNWSDNPASNAMHLGDSWSLSFWVVANGPPYSTVPVDACVLKPDCISGGSGPEGGVYTWASYVPLGSRNVLTVSFPLATVEVLAAQSPLPPPSVPPSAPPPPIATVVPVGPPVAVGTAIGVGAPVSVGSVALQGVAAGFLAAGFLRIGMKNRPIAMAVAMKSGFNPSSKFDQAQREANQAGIGRFE